jgi:hypothetical protein
MTPKQAERLTQKISAIRRTLAAEKKKFGWYDDSRGLRYLPTRYYVQLGEFKSGLSYTRWFSKNFPDDVGFPDFLFEWTLLLFQNAKLKEAEQKAVETFCADRQLFDQFLTRPVAPAEPWEETPLPTASYATYFASLGQPIGLEKFAQWLAAFMATERFLARAAQYQHLRRQLHTEQDAEKRQALVSQLQQVTYAPFLP